MTISYDLESITPHTVANTTGEGRGNAGGLALRNFCIAIDSTMYVKTGEILRNTLENKFNLPVKFLVITHYHGDHIFGIKSFKDVCVLSSELTSKIMLNEETKSRYQVFIKDLAKEGPIGEDIEYIVPTLLFTDKIIIQDEDLHIEIFHTGGHTAGSSFISFPYEKVVFTGDLIFEDTFPYAGDPSCNPELLIKALQKMYDLNSDIYIPGHGPILKGADSLKRHIKFYEDLKNIIKDAISENLDSAKISVPDTFGEPDENRRNMTVNTWLNFYKNK
ncbi:MAG: MBL fold metallo-hydrolase [Promethearchaeota archaeon]|jgi:glyoxylase-like metal-dependent hydrolase (beta-lactamase superfamily II)